jgi:hypothetical protein
MIGIPIKGVMLGLSNIKILHRAIQKIKGKKIRYKQVQTVTKRLAFFCSIDISVTGSSALSFSRFIFFN